MSPDPSSTLNSLAPGSFRLYDVAGVRALDRVAIEEYTIPGITLMKRAAQACVDLLLARWPTATRIVVLCGSGNNAGDGFIIAGLLAAKGLKIQVCLVGKPPQDDTDAGQAYRFCLGSDAATPVTDINTDWLQEADVIVDALLGTGLDREVQETFARIIRLVNQSTLPVLSVDIPSGLCADTGRRLGVCIKASATVTFIGRKLGLYTNDGPEYAGDILFSGLGLPDAVYDSVEDWVELLAWKRLISQVPLRHKNAHKTNHGHLLVVGGDDGMGGAVALAAGAAIYAGAGLVSVATRHSNVASIIARHPEIMAQGLEDVSDLIPLIERASAIVLGPGLGQGDWGRAVFNAVMSTELPLLLDADGLNFLSTNKLSTNKLSTSKLSASKLSTNKPAAETHTAADEHILKARILRGNHVLTPHPGEASRLLDGTDIQADRKAAVKRLQTVYSGVVLLKGAGTLIADDAGVYLNPYGNPGMAVAGMGDVLSGVIGSLLAQGHAPRDAARLGAAAHSLAADRIVAMQGERGLLASELLPVMRRLLNNKPTST